MSELSIVALQPVEDAGIKIGDEYTLGEVLGSGLTARVVKGQPVASSRPLVALKIAFGGMAPSERIQFWRELELLRVLSSTGYVPWAAAAAYADQADRPEPQRTPILIMQLIDPAAYPELAAGVHSAADEARALAAAVQYADLLRKMHTDGVTTRLDRKLADLRWQETGDGGHLIVLDWNRAFYDSRVQELKLKAIDQYSADERQMMQAQRAHEQDDIRLFGRLWSQMLLRRQLDPDNLPPLTDDAAWGNLTPGTRHILAQSMLSRLHNGYQLAVHLHKQLSDQFEIVRTGSNQVPAWMPRLDRNALGRTRDAMLGAIRSNLNLSEYALATQGVTDALRTAEFRASDADASRARLQLHRLGAIAAAGDVGLQAGLWMREKIRSLLAIADHLHNPSSPYTPVDINAVEKQLADVLADADQLRSALSALITETAIWYYFVRSSANEIQAHGDQLTEVDKPYAADLYAGHPRLNRLLAERVASTTRESLRADFDTALHNLLAELEKEPA